MITGELQALFGGRVPTGAIFSQLQGDISNLSSHESRSSAAD